MNEQEQVAETRLAQLFAKCEANPGGEHHAWNFNTRECEYCKASFPYPKDEP